MPIEVNMALVASWRYALMRFTRKHITKELAMEIPLPFAMERDAFQKCPLLSYNAPEFDGLGANAVVRQEVDVAMLVAPA